MRWFVRAATENRQHATGKSPGKSENIAKHGE
jgi:hypothetical protein